MVDFAIGCHVVIDKFMFFCCECCACANHQAFIYLVDYQKELLVFLKAFVVLLWSTTSSNYTNCT
jgi:hypothetical protein